jgi:hypothetical protein
VQAVRYGDMHRLHRIVTMIHPISQNDPLRRPASYQRKFQDVRVRALSPHIVYLDTSTLFAATLAGRLWGVTAFTHWPLRSQTSRLNSGAGPVNSAVIIFLPAP